MERPRPKDNERLRADIDAARRIAMKPRLRFRELVKLWNNEKAPRPQSYVEVERTTEDLIDYLGDIPVESFASDIHHFDGRNSNQWQPMSSVAHRTGVGHARQSRGRIEFMDPAIAFGEAMHGAMPGRIGQAGIGMERAIGVP